MKKLLVFAFLVTAYASPNASADLLLAFDVDPATPGVQTDIITSAAFSVDVVLTLGAGDMVSGYGFVVDYDDTEFTVASVTHSPPGSFSPVGMPDSSTSGTVEAFRATWFNTTTFMTVPALAGPASFTLATIDFSPVAIQGAAGETGDLDFRYVPGVDGLFDTSSADLRLVPGAVAPSPLASISSIPEPSPRLYAMMLLVFVGGVRWLKTNSMEA